MEAFLDAAGTSASAELVPPQKKKVEGVRFVHSWRTFIQTETQKNNAF